MKKTRILLRIAITTAIAVTIMTPGSNIVTNNIRSVLITPDNTYYENYIQGS